MYICRPNIPKMRAIDLRGRRKRLPAECERGVSEGRGTEINGLMAEWLGKGLQNLVQRFESASDLTETAL